MGVPGQGAPDFRGTSSPLAAPKDCQEALHLRVLRSQLSGPPGGHPHPGAGPSSAAPPPTLPSYLPPALPPTFPSPGFWHSMAQSPTLLPTPRAAPGPGVGKPSPVEGGCSEATRDEEEGRGRPWQPAWHVCPLGVNGAQESRPQPNVSSPHPTVSHLPQGWAAGSSRCSS